MAKKENLPKGEENNQTGSNRQEEMTQITIPHAISGDHGFEHLGILNREDELDNRITYSPNVKQPKKIADTQWSIGYEIVGSIHSSLNAISSTTDAAAPTVDSSVEYCCNGMIIFNRTQRCICNAIPSIRCPSMLCILNFVIWFIFVILAWNVLRGQETTSGS